MKPCLVCFYAGSERTKTVEGHRTCPRCGLPAYPKTQASIEASQKIWLDRGEIDKSGHRRGFWGDYADQAV